MLMLISQQDAEIEEKNIFNKILRCVLYFNTKGTATIKPLFGLGEHLYLYTPLVRSISYRYQSDFIYTFYQRNDQKVNLRGIGRHVLLFQYSREN